MEPASGLVSDVGLRLGDVGHSQMGVCEKARAIKSNARSHLSERPYRSPSFSLRVLFGHNTEAMWRLISRPAHAA